MKEPARAIPMLRELIALNPQDHASRFNLAAALLETGRIDGALELCSGSPRPALARVEGYIHQKNAQLDAAAKASTLAREARPDDPAHQSEESRVETACVDEYLTVVAKSIKK